MGETAEKSGAVKGLKVAYGRGVAVLSVDGGAPRGSFSHVVDALSASGMTVVPDIAPDGSRLLRISGYRHSDDLKGVLRQQGIVPTESELGLAGGKYSFRRIKDHSLKASGITYLLGDASLFVSGLLAGKPKEAFAGLLYASGGLVSAVYGNPSNARQVKNAGVRLGDFLEKSLKVSIPADSVLHRVMAQRAGGLLEKAQNLLYRHPSEIHNAIYAFGGTQLFGSGLRGLKGGGKGAGARDDMVAGALVTAGGAIGAAVEERHGKDNDSSSAAVRWIREKPLRLAGYLYTLNNVFLIKGALATRKADPKDTSHMFKLATAGLFLIANSFMSMTSRDHRGDREAAEARTHSLEGLAAEVIARQPSARRASLLHQVAAFLSLQPETKQEVAVLEQSLARKVEALESSPWKKAPDENPEPAFAAPRGKSWTERTAGLAAGQVQPGMSV